MRGMKSENSTRRGTYLILEEMTEGKDVSQLDNFNEVEKKMRPRQKQKQDRERGKTK